MCGEAFRIVRNSFNDFLTLLFNRTIRANSDKEQLRKQSSWSDR